MGHTLPNQSCFFVLGCFWKLARPGLCSFVQGTYESYPTSVLNSDSSAALQSFHGRAVWLKEKSTKVKGAWLQALLPKHLPAQPWQMAHGFGITYWFVCLVPSPLFL